MFHHEEGALWPQDTKNLLQRPALRFALELVEGVRTGDRIEGAGCEGKAPRVGFHQMDIEKAPSLSVGHLQHAVGKIHTDNLSLAADLRLQVGEKSTRTGADVENRTAVLDRHPIGEELPGQALRVAGMECDEAVVKP